MAKATKTIEIKAPLKTVYQTITDYESYPEFLKETESVVLGKKSGKSTEVTYTLDLIKKITYTLLMTEVPPNRLKWKFVKGDVLKKNEGEWLLEEVKPGVTSATYTIEVDLGFLVPGSVSKMLVEKNLPTMLAAFKKRSESKKKP